MRISIVLATMLATMVPTALFASTAGAQVEVGTGDDAGTTAPYDWAFRARSIEPRGYARIDTSLATYSDRDPSRRGYAMAQLFGVGVVPLESLVLHARGGWAFSQEPRGSEGALAANVEVGATLIERLSPAVRVAGHLSVFLPTGSAQGSDAPSHERRARMEDSARASGSTRRSSRRTSSDSRRRCRWAGCTAAWSRSSSSGSNR
ncbi:MAG: hypothetical protein M3Y87_00325 [Myxococcota bacterium]|nr:hypothetical protein [Myxococcota bacterium]